MSKTLISWGFKINPYDWCVANKMINGEQMTIVWYVDDMKISHKDSKLVTNIMKKLDKRYGKTASGHSVPPTVTRESMNIWG